MASKPPPIDVNFLEARYIPEPNTGCWLWTGALNSQGYGRFERNRRGARKVYRAHRVSYELHKGLIPDGMEPDHLCRVRCCINPAHLEAVTPLENMKRSACYRFNARKTHCPRGHVYTIENTRIGKSGSRFCRACSKERLAAAKAIRHARGLGPFGPRPGFKHHV